ncbi:MAG: hypothetical protein J6I79_01670 [Paludibacteraceae bacterium]|nr:hypothetical protein [Paludibacteraceae bacterium]
MNSKSIFFTIVPLLFSLQQATAEVLVVEDKQGEKQYYELGDAPVITYSGAKLLVNTDKASAEFNIPEVEKYYFLKELTASKLIEDGDKAVVWTTGEKLSIRNGGVNQTVQVFNAQGKLTSTHKTDSQGALDLDLGQSGKGVVLIKISSTTVKLIIK